MFKDIFYIIWVLIRIGVGAAPWFLFGNSLTFANFAGMCLWTPLVYAFLFKNEYGVKRKVVRRRNGMDFKTDGFAMSPMDEDYLIHNQ